ncbi:hypothetical protein [Rhizobium halophytocola]|uniref:Zn-dependent protease n=1 Tax=Rhizobium halophytocola TaxID=735519 RepID=A0ABS4DZN5_9HYPH|nr:hypothetical protein [Rhizobium halophytocola]MBP1851156.1 Zn-dependent protease [Rhizobium halophytocola]
MPFELPVEPSVVQLTTIVLLLCSLVAIWLLMAAPIGRRTVRLSRVVDARPETVARLLEPARLAQWNDDLTAARALDNPDRDDARLVELTYKAAGRKGEPIRRTVRATALPDAAGQVFGEERSVVDDTVLAQSFWQHFSERRIISREAGGQARITFEQSDRYRGFGGLLFRRRWMQRELERLSAAAENREPKSMGHFGHPAVQVGLAILSTLMLWPFFGRNASGLMLSTILTLVIVLHELGHMAAYRAFGHEKVRMLFLPILGGVAIGGRPYDSRFEAAACALMGPGLSAFFVPILISAIRTGGFGLSSATTHVLAIALLILGAFNLLNLLPMSRFDGGQVLRQLCPNRPTLLLGSLAASALIVATGWHIGVPPIALIASLAVFTLLSLIGGQSFSTRLVLEDITLSQRVMIGLGLYGTIALHALAVSVACDLLLI